MLFLILSILLAPVALLALWVVYKILYFQITRALYYRHIPRMAAPAMTLLTTDLDADKDFRLFFDALRDSPDTYHPIVDCGVYPDGTVAIGKAPTASVATSTYLRTLNSLLRSCLRSHCSQNHSAESEGFP